MGLAGIYDLSAVILVGLFAVRGYIQGGVKSICKLLLLVVCAFFAFQISSFCGEKIYNNFLADNVEGAITQGVAAISEQVGDVAENVTNNTAATIDTETFTDLLKRLYDNVDNAVIKGVLNTITDENGVLSGLHSTEIQIDGSLAEYLNNALIKPAVLGLVNITVFLLVFLLLRAVCGIIVSKLDVINNVPLIGTLNKVLGLAAGLIIGVVLVYLAVCLVNVLAGAGVSEIFSRFELKNSTVCSVFLSVDFTAIWNSVNELYNDIAIKIASSGTVGQ